MTQQDGMCDECGGPRGAETWYAAQVELKRCHDALREAGHEFSIEVEARRRAEAALAALRAENARMREALDLVQSIASEGFEHWVNDRDHQAGKNLKCIAGLAPGYRPDLDAALAPRTSEEADRG